MRTTHRDRRRLAFSVICLALILICIPVAAEEATFRVLPSGTAYEASVQVTASDEYTFWTPGHLGEKIPLNVEDIEVVGPEGSVEYRNQGRGLITFPEGRYNISYQAPLRDNHFMVAFDKPYTVNLILPPEFDIKNPLLGMVSPGGTVSARPDGALEVTWDRVKSAEIRFYSPEREILLIAFGTVWLAAFGVLLIPYALSWGRRRL